MPATTTRTATTRRPRRVLALSALLSGAGLSLAGCAGSGVPALADVWPEVSDSIENAQSVAIDGSVTRDGQDLTVSIAGQVDDSSYAGQVSTGDIDVEIVGNTEFTYLKPNTAFYEQNDSAQLQEMVGEKWLQTPAGQGGFTMSTLWDAFVEDVPTADEFGNSDYTSEAVELNGEDVYKYTGSHEGSGDPVSVYVSHDHRLLRVEAASGPTDDASATASASASSASGTGTIDFSRWDAVEPVEMPSKDTVFSVPAR